MYQNHVMIVLAFLAFIGGSCFANMLYDFCGSGMPEYIGCGTFEASNLISATLTFAHYMLSFFLCSQILDLNELYFPQ
jgi:hypothetical protein